MDKNVDKLLTQKDLAERWQVTKKTIENYRQTGVLQAVKGIPAVRFNPQYIAELEGTKLERFSPIERRKMQQEIDTLKQENEKLKGIIANVLAHVSQAVTF